MQKTLKDALNITTNPTNTLALIENTLKYVSLQSLNLLSGI